MKKWVLLMFISIHVLGYSQGKKGFYGYINTGYKFGSVYTTFPNEYIVTGDKISNSYIRFGGGNNITGAFGWMIHDNFGMEVSSTYTLGKEKEISNGNVVNNNLDKITKTACSNNIHAVGSFVAQASVANFKLYAKAGVVIGFYNRTTITDQFQLNGTALFYAYNYEGTIMRGFNGSLGILYPLGKHLSLMVEAEEVSIQGSFKSAQLSSNNTGGELPQELIYMDDISKMTNTSSTYYLRSFPISYSCIGLNVGLHYAF